MTTTAAHEAVRNGIAVLDREIPNWRDKIDLDSFDIESSWHCVLGQVFGEGTYAGYSTPFHKGASVLFGLYPEVVEGDADIYDIASDHGFETPRWSDRFDYDDLDFVWRDYLTK